MHARRPQITIVRDMDSRIMVSRGLFRQILAAITALRPLPPPDRQYTPRPMAGSAGHLGNGGSNCVDGLDFWRDCVCREHRSGSVAGAMTRGDSVMGVKLWGAAALALGAGLLAAAPAQAAFVFTMQEVAGGVELNGSGTINTAALTIGGDNGFGVAGVLPGQGVVRAGDSSLDMTEWFGVTGPASFGPGNANLNTTARSGDPIVIVGIGGYLLLHKDYASGSQISNTGLFAGATLALLGVTPGDYVWTWGREDQADSLTLRILDSTAVPEPATALLLGAGLLGLAVARRRAKRDA